MDTIEGYYYLEQYGFDKTPAADFGFEESLHGFAKTMINALSADGKASQKELDWLIGYLRTKKFPQSCIDDVPVWAKEAEAKSVEDLAREAKDYKKLGFLGKATRAMLYESMRCSAVDGLDERELKAIKVIGKELGMSGEVVDQLKEQIEEEAAIRLKRLALLFPEGHPCLAEEYMPKKEEE